MIKQNSIIVSLACFFSLLAAPAVNANSTSASLNASQESVVHIARGSVEVLKTTGNLSIVSLQQSGNVMSATLEDAGKSIKFTVEVSKELAKQASLAVGETVRVVAESSGYALIASGKLIAFVPNTLGESLVHHSRY